MTLKEGWVHLLSRGGDHAVAARCAPLAVRTGELGWEACAVSFLTPGPVFHTAFLVDGRCSKWCACQACTRASERYESLWIALAGPLTLTDIGRNDSIRIDDGTGATNGVAPRFGQLLAVVVETPNA